MENGLMADNLSPAPLSASVVRRDVDQDESVAANRTWWDGEADEYYAEHGGFLGDSGFVWGPEGCSESELQLLGDPAGRRILEIGAGAAQCARYLRGQGAQVVATDFSGGMLRQGAVLNAADVQLSVPLAQCDALRLPFGDASFDTVFTSYGVVPFVADSAALMREVARVLVDGGGFVYSTTHPLRWAMPDDPSDAGLRITGSYFDRTPYVELDAHSQPTYVEHHRTLGDRVREAVAAGLTVVDVIEPEWPADNQQTWGGWSPLRGQVIPGTLIMVCRRG